MALSKSFPFIDPYTGETLNPTYWKITGGRIERIGREVRCELSLFMNQAQAAIGKPKIRSKTFSFNFTPEEMNGNIVETCYDKIKADNDPELVGATDV